jgi:hypothetical protein
VTDVYLHNITPNTTICPFYFVTRSISFGINSNLLDNSDFEITVKDRTSMFNKCPYFLVDEYPSALMSFPGHSIARRGSIPLPSSPTVKQYYTAISAIKNYGLVSSSNNHTLEITIVSQHFIHKTLPSRTNN